MVTQVYTTYASQAAHLNQLESQCSNGRQMQTCWGSDLQVPKQQQESCLGMHNMLHYHLHYHVLHAVQQQI